MTIHGEMIVAGRDEVSVIPSTSCRAWITRDACRGIRLRRLRLETIETEQADIGVASVGVGRDNR